MAPFEILHEDNHLLVINKPAELPTMGVAEGEPSVLSLAKQWIKQRDQKPGNVYLGVVSRLDAPVTGVLLMAKTSKAASRLSEQFRSRNVTKIYRAIVEGVPDSASQELLHYLRKDERHRRVHVTRQDTQSAQEARLRFRALSTSTQHDLSLVEVELLTGRKHQIRVQLAAVGHSILGDRKYKGSVHFSPGIALHAYRLEFTHPVQKKQICVQTAPPPSWDRWMNKIAPKKSGKS